MMNKQADPALQAIASIVSILFFGFMLYWMSSNLLLTTADWGWWEYVDLLCVFAFPYFIITSVLKLREATSLMKEQA